MTGACYHCGEVLDEKNIWTIENKNQTLKFCCPACKAVYQCINANGLDQYYTLRTEPATRLVEDSIDYSHYDILTSDSYFISDINDDKQVTFFVAGVHCSACTWLLENVLKKIDGVINVEVNLHLRKLSIVWQPEKIKLSQLMEKIHALGYEPIEWQGAAHYQTFKQEKNVLQRRLGVAGLLMMQVGMFSIGLYAGDWQGMDGSIQYLLRLASALLSTIVILYCASPFYLGAYRSVKNLSVNMDVPVVLALSVAYVVSIFALLTQAEDIYFDTVCMFVFFLLLSRYIEMRSREPTQSSQTDLLPLTVERRHLNATLNNSYSSESVAVSSLLPDDIILCRAGSQVAADGVIVESKSSFDESAFTGESLPCFRDIGDTLFAGTMNLEQAVWLKVTASAKNSRIHQISLLIDKATLSKPKYAATIDSLSPWFVLMVLLCSAFTAVFWSLTDPEKALKACLAVLVVSCPCALSLATPTAITAANQCLRRAGIVPVSSRFLERLPKITDIVFDKTGTLSTGTIELQHIKVMNTTVSKADVLQIAASLEIYSDHPIAQAFKSAYKHPLLTVHKVNVVIGCGVEATINKQQYRIGSRHWCAEFLHLNNPHSDAVDSSNILLCTPETVLAELSFDDSLRADAVATVDRLSKDYQVHLLSGDNFYRVEKIAKQLKLNCFFAEATPEDKLNKVRDLQNQGAKVLMIGDGINDSPVLASADVSIAMSNANDLSKSKADAVLLTLHLQSIPLAIQYARYTRNIIKQNIGWAILYNGISMPLAAAALLPPWLAAIGMSLSSVVVVLNAQRLRKLSSRSKLNYSKDQALAFVGTKTYKSSWQ